jgi:nitrite reductase/ring-hydroxylating ferredoxin subunit
MTTDRNGWHAVALSNDVEPASSNGTHLFGEEIVVWRDGAGAPHVWVDRCPHRGMRLSYGYVRADRIACLYHGWQYGTDGRCLRIPAHPDIEPPASIVVWRHSCREAMGLIFARLGEATDAPALPAGTVGRAFVPVRSIHVGRPAEVLVDRFAALAIRPFHPGLKGETFDLRSEGPLVVGMIEKAGVSEMLVGAVQPIAADRSALHLVVGGSGTAYRGAGQRHFARAAESLRDGLEGGWLPPAGRIPAFA